MRRADLPASGEKAGEPVRRLLRLRQTERAGRLRRGLRPLREDGRRGFVLFEERKGDGTPASGKESAVFSFFFPAIVVN